MGKQESTLVCNQNSDGISNPMYILAAANILHLKQAAMLLFVVLNIIEGKEICINVSFPCLLFVSSTVAITSVEKQGLCHEGKAKRGAH